ncbi:queuosine precursor transporter [Desulfovermiculus halophilus]|uniref:queuosine precursor transporter n=1 Tax=Desulfovermiculus halophilus TaxID=339722 RepID=UPI000557CC8D|nr:queuosine precursor transporter [Desulfovermiculus halophilus]
MIPPQRTQASPQALAILTSLFAGSLVLAAVLATKIITVAGLTVPAGVLAYALTFICTDVIGEVWGKERAREVVGAGFVALIAAFGLIQLALHWPPADFWSGQQAFAAVLATTPRIIAGSLAAYLVSQFTDVWIFHACKRLTRGRHLWLRNNLSTALSQFIDTVIFISIAFGGVMPLLPLFAGQWAVKMVIAAVDTGVVYLLVWGLGAGGRHNGAGEPA